MCGILREGEAYGEKSKTWCPADLRKYISPPQHPYPQHIHHILVTGYVADGEERATGIDY